MKNQIEKYFDRLWPLNRSLSGNGNRKTLEIISELVDLQITEVPSGTQCFDWTVPPEWNVKEAWVKDPSGKKIIDFSVNNLHLLGYSVPFSGKLAFGELKEHLYTLPDQPALIPYLTSYYSRKWGFCLSQQQLDRLDKNAEYEVLIDSSLDENGSMTIGEAVIEGNSGREILFSTYICHPSMANNELSGPLVCSFLYSLLKQKKNLKYTYRFLFVPETIGSIYYLSKRGSHFREFLDAGFIVTCIGDAGNFTYKRSRRGNSLADRVVETLLNQTEKENTIRDFFPMGSDERQYCSPGFDLPVGTLTRTMYYDFPEYHTSGDNKDLISFEAMEQSVGKFSEIVDILENNWYYVNTMPDCEPQLVKRGLYPTLGSQKETRKVVDAMMWILNLSDGKNDLIDISFRSGIPVNDLIPVKDRLLKSGLIRI